jgi:hypothetical protein
MALVVSVVALSGSAGAEEKGVEIGLRSGYGIALGNAGENGDFNDFIAGNVPLWFDLGYRITPNVMVGGYFSYGFGFKGDFLDAVCPAGVDCSVHNMRLGAQVHYHFMPWQSADPWLGAGFGYEWLSMSSSAGNLEASLGLRGFELVNLQGGVDFMPSDDANFGLGPFIAFSVAQITAQSCDLPVGADTFSCDGDVPTSTHEWLTLGIRGTFVP